MAATVEGAVHPNGALVAILEAWIDAYIDRPGEPVTLTGEQRAAMAAVLVLCRDELAQADIPAEGIAHVARELRDIAAKLDQAVRTAAGT